jgi:hypothetical protein
MRKILKSLFLPVRLNEIHDGVGGHSEPEGWEDERYILFGDLPRQTDPTGVDDTAKIQELCIRVFPELYYCPDQTVNRRKLYMAIYKLRKETPYGWAYDGGPQTPIHVARNLTRVFGSSSPGNVNSAGG